MKYQPLLIGLLFLTRCVPVGSSSSSDPGGTEIDYDNRTYENVVGIVQFFPTQSSIQTGLDYPVISLGDPGMTLSFDLFEENAAYLNAYLIHCSVDWRPSPLADIQYLSVYNEFPIDNFEYSINTRVPYVHYRAEIPAPEKSGNYLLVVYRENNRKDLLLSRRFLVVDQSATIRSVIRVSSIVAQRRTHHEVVTRVNFEGLSQVNPLRDFKLVILQNHNWNMALTGLQPTRIQLDQNFLEYDHFDGQGNFPAGNEFRFVDLRSVDFRGMNVTHIRLNETDVQIFVNPDRPRNGLSYSQLNNDLNGGFFLTNSDPNKGRLQSEYAKVYFELNTDPVDGNVYLHGSFNHWSENSGNRMAYDSAKNAYRIVLELKQGYYNYQYLVRSKHLSPYHFEGNHFQTINDYETLLYYRNPTKNYDELVGYSLFSSRN